MTIALRVAGPERSGGMSCDPARTHTIRCCGPPDTRLEQAPVGASLVVLGDREQGPDESVVQEMRLEPEVDKT
jgi:hypothetical protein